MVKGVIKSGVCGFTINVEAECSDGQNVKLNITSDCPNYQKIAGELQYVDAYKEIFQKLHLGEVYSAFSKHSPHQSCPGPSGILKTIEVAAGLALPQSAGIEVRKEGN